VDAFFEARYLMFIKLAAFHLQQLGLRNLREQEIKNKAIEANDDIKKMEIENNLNKDFKENEESLQENAQESKTGEEAEEYKKIVESYTSGEKSDIDSTKEIVRKAAQSVGSLKDNEFDIRFNPDVFSPGVKHSDPSGESLKKQTQLVKDAAEFLLTVQITGFVCLLVFLLIFVRF
jgi:protein TIF31